MAKDKNCDFLVDVINKQDHLSTLFKFLGKRDLDLVYMYYYLGKTQKELSEIFGQTQPAVFYSVKKIKKKLDFITYLLSVVDEFIYFLVNDADQFNKSGVDILVMLFFSTSFTKTSKTLGVNQITCRNRFDHVMNELKEKEYDDIVAIFDEILKNLNMVRKTLKKKKVVTSSNIPPISPL